jgi:hypothetical protein
MTPKGHSPIKRQILISLMAILLAGCLDSDHSLKPGTEMMLSQDGAYFLTVKNMEKGLNDRSVSKGTKVRVITHSPDKDEIDVYVLEGPNRNENFTLNHFHLLPIQSTP